MKSVKLKNLILKKNSDTVELFGVTDSEIFTPYVNEDGDLVLGKIGNEKEWELKGTITTETKEGGAIVDLSGCSELVIFGSGVGTANTPLAFGSNVLIETCIPNGARNFYAEFKSIECRTGIFPLVGKYGSSESAVALTGNFNCYSRGNINISDINKINFTIPNNVTTCNIEIWAR